MSHQSIHAARNRIVAIAILFFSVSTFFAPLAVTARNPILSKDFEGNEVTGLLILRQSLTTQKSWRQLAEQIPDPLLALQQQEYEGRAHSSREGPNSKFAENNLARPSGSFAYALTAGILCAAMRSAHREPEARAIEHRALHVVQPNSTRTSFVKSQLVETAIMAKQTRVHHLAWGWEASKSLRNAFVASVVFLIVSVMTLTDIAYQQLKPRWTKSRNGAKTWLTYLLVVTFVVVALLALNADSLPYFVFTLGGWSRRTPSLAFSLAGLFTLIPLLLRTLSYSGLHQANISLNAGKFEQCLQQCEDSLRKHPRSVGIYVTASAAAVNLEMFDRGIELCETALKIASPKDKDLAMTYNNLASLYASQRNDGKALEFALKAIKTNPSLVEPQFLKVISLCNLKRIDEAWEEVEIIQDDFFQHFAKAGVLSLQNLREEAAKECELAASAGGPARVTFILPLRAAIRADDGKISQAIEDCCLAISASPKRSDIRELRARWYAIDGQFEKAEEDLAAQSSYGRPNYWLAFSHNTRAIIALKKNGDALPHAEQADKLFPDEPDFLVQLGMAHFKNQNFERAIEALTKAIALNKYCAAAHYYRFQIYESLNRFDEANSDKEIATGFDFRPYL